MLSLLDLPCEIKLRIFELCDFLTRLKLRQVCQQCDAIIRMQLHAQKCLDLKNDYGAQVNIIQWKFIHFLHSYLSHLQILLLNDNRLRLSLATLIRIASSVPDLQQLTIEQEDATKIDLDALHGLGYFRQLRMLNLNALNTENSVGKGCRFRNEIPAMHRLQKLKEWRMHCQYDTLGRMLRSLRDREALLENLTTIDFAILHCTVDFPELLIWFLRHHEHLECVTLANILFVTADQLRRFYISLLLLDHLRQLNLLQCTICDRLPLQLQNEFSAAMERRGICTKNLLVKSMRYSPEFDL